MRSIGLSSLFLCASVFGFAATMRVVPSYENASVYVDAAKGNDPATLQVSYREAGSDVWLAAHALVASEGDTVPRGSLFGLHENRSYEVRCSDASGRRIASANFNTWADDVPVARTINVKELSPDHGPVLIDIGGQPDAWVRYVADPGTVINGGDEDEEAVLVEDVQYVILDGLTVVGGRRHGIQVRNSQNVRIRKCDISGFGRVGGQDLKRHGQFYMPGDSKPINWDAGVYVDLSGDLTIENNYIHDPRGRANSWYYAHPAGPNAIFVRSTGGMVIRYNDLVGSERHRWNDVIEGYGNQKVDGGFNRDSDIYGNFLAYANDDGIELDGGQCNVRFYGNKIEGGLCGISTAPNVRGPSYIFNNLVANLGDERGAASAGVKNGGGKTYSKGTTYFYHNTFFTMGNGVTAVGFGSDANRGMFLGHTRDNVFATSGPGINDTVRAPGNTYDHDVFAKPDGRVGEYDVSGEVEANGKALALRFRDAAHGDFSLAADVALPAPSAIPGFAFLQNDVSAPGVVSTEMPARPHAAFALDAGQLMLTSITGSGEQEARITIRSLDDSRPQNFTVLKNAATDWIAVQPATGVLPAGGETVVTVRLLAEGLAGKGLHMGCLLVRTADGNARPVSVYGIVSAERVRQLHEAEALPGADAFKTMRAADASAGASLQFYDQAAGKSGKGDKYLSVPIELKEPGAIYVAFRVRAPKPYGNHDSLFVSLDGQAQRLCSLSVSGSWQWSRLTGEAMHLSLPAGSHVLRVQPREDVELDAILVTDRPLMAGDDQSKLLETVSDQ